MHSRAGTYTPFRKNYCGRLELVDMETARQVGVALHGSVMAMEDHVRLVTEQKWQRYHYCLAVKPFTNSFVHLPTMDHSG